MSRQAAIRAALSLIKVPTQARMLRALPLPEGVSLLLKVAVRDSEALSEAAALTGRPSEHLVDASGFFIEQILLHPDADSYRALGAEPRATTGDIRVHMALLMRWLHPDVDPSRAHLANRVLRAWDDVKTPERRKALDLLLQATSPKPQKPSHKTFRHFRVRRPRQPRVLRFLSFLARRPHN